MRNSSIRDIIQEVHQSGLKVKYMYCSAYNEFYSLLASNTLILISIFVALGIYLWQNRSIDEKRIEKKIQKLTDVSINVFIKSKPLIDRIPSKEPKNIIEDVHEYYADWKNENSDRSKKIFFYELDTLQDKIHSDLVDKLKIYDRNDGYIINLNEYNKFMKQLSLT